MGEGKTSFPNIRDLVPLWSPESAMVEQTWCVVNMVEANRSISHEMVFLSWLQLNLSGLRTLSAPHVEGLCHLHLANCSEYTYSIN